MTNREYLNTLSIDEFSRVVLEQTVNLVADYFDPDSEVFEIALDIEFAFSEWLTQEYSGEDDSEEL